ncbi:GNAT family N-acetyltransferase [Microdochium nivale]|nr:GNAT family N-acetyltransferase [Microdochium nivale]
MADMIISTTPAGPPPVARSEPPSIHLIPWDPDSPEHTERMRLQRVACGWKAEMVRKWAAPQRTGKIGLYWIVLSPSHPQTDSRLSSHWAAFEEESTPLKDSIKTGVLGKPHAVDPQLEEFHPIGHISLDAWGGDPRLGTSADKGVYSLNTFYVSTVLQNCGLGSAAFKECERMAKEELGAKTITLNTIAPEELAEDNPTRIKTGRLVPKITNYDWYTRQGYTVYDRKANAWEERDPAGNRYPIESIYMRKDLV